MREFAPLSLIDAKQPSKLLRAMTGAPCVEVKSDASSSLCFGWWGPRENLAIRRPQRLGV